VEALEAPDAYDGQTLVSQFVNVVGLLGLIASFFSIIYAYSRQTFALSRAGYLPKWLSVTGKRKTPTMALIVPGVIGFVMAVMNQGDLLILVAVFGATISYIMMNLSHIILRIKEPNLERPYRTPGGVVTTGIALVLAVAALIAGFLVDTRVLTITAGVFVVAIAYFGLYSRHHIVGTAPEEEFALIESAESELH
jgi:ethanolamine permease